MQLTVKVTNLHIDRIDQLSQMGETRCLVSQESCNAKRASSQSYSTYCRHFDTQLKVGQCDDDSSKQAREFVVLITEDTSPWLV